MIDWQRQLASALASAADRDPREVIDDIVRISERFPSEQWPAMLGESRLPDEVTGAARDIYSKYIHGMERAGQAHALAGAKLRSARFADICDPEARVSYDRVSDLFDVLRALGSRKERRRIEETGDLRKGAVNAFRDHMARELTDLGGRTQGMWPFMGI